VSYLFTTRGMAAGLYLIRFVVDGKNYSRKVIIR